MQHARQHRGRRVRREAKRQHIKRLRMKKQRAQHAQRSHRPRTNSPRTSGKSPKNSLRIQKPIRDRWAAIAEETQRIVLGDGQYVEERIVPAVSSAVAQSYTQGSSFVDPLISSLKALQMQPAHIAHNIFSQIQLSRQGTIFFPHYSDSLANWATAQKRALPTLSQTNIKFVHDSTLLAARQLAQSMSSNTSRIGVLSFASPKKPGGGFLHGGDEQEETIARLSSLVASLTSPAAQDFYKEHKKHWSEDGSGLHDHSMLYSPGVVVFRADGDDEEINLGDPVGGAFISPYQIDVVSAVPVNAAAVRAKHIILPSERQFFEDGIRGAMKERMARILRVFEEKGDKVLVLGAFGCGSSQNDVEVIASLWAELLVCGDNEQHARFRDVFERVVFAVPGKLFTPFRRAFDMRVFEQEVASAASD
ncbi:unnamed protein product [Somion occarium]|uniref:Microbial-type PARG catalytic domain-containing protein n=1 Tax=Somion occarium TaxID=3059160 RepID=A0ABP1DWC5_9APHY